MLESPGIFMAEARCTQALGNVRGLDGGNEPEDGQG